MFVIYRALNTKTNKCYIGYTNNFHRRKNSHKNTSKKGSNLYFHRAIIKYGYDSFVWSILENCTKENTKEREMYWIAFYDSFNNGYNMTKGGDGLLGYKLLNGRTESWKIKQSLSHITNSKIIQSRLLLNDNSIYTNEQRVVYSENQKGELNSSSKLSKIDVFKFYELWGSGKFTLSDIAKLYPVDRRHVGRIVKGITRINDFKEYHGKQSN